MTPAKDTHKNTFWTRLLLVLLGITLIVGGYFAVSRPAATFTALTLMVGIVAVARGIFAIVAYLRIKEVTTWKAKGALALGVLLVIVGLLCIFWPAVLSAALAWLVGLWFLAEAIRGLGQVRLIRALDRTAGILSLMLNLLLIAAGVLLIVNPWVPTLAVSVLVAASFFASGLDMILTALFLPNNHVKR